MNSPFSVILVLIAIQVYAKCVTADKVHEQVHIALGTDETEMVVTWQTLHHIADGEVPQVKYGSHKESLGHVVDAEVTHFNREKVSFYTYRALLTNLRPQTKYYYRVGSENTEWSEVFHFNTLTKGADWSPRIAIIGDLGLQFGVSFAYLLEDVQKEKYDVIFHIGDLAYNFETHHGRRGHNYMNEMEPIIANVPYMTCPGNHEHHDNYSHYDARFSMIGDRHDPQHGAQLTNRINNHFHSVDIGPAHIIMYSTEFYYYYERDGADQIGVQFDYLEKDLQAANENREERPWIIVMAHRPMYCLKIGDPTCDEDKLERKPHRSGIDEADLGLGRRRRRRRDSEGNLMFGLEDLFYKYGVDLHFYGHEHFYARTLPVYQHNSEDENKKNPYENPNAPVHVTSGSAGNWELKAKFNPKMDEVNYVGQHIPDYGFTRISFDGSLHLILEQNSIEKNGEVVDKIDLIKDSPMPAWLRE